ncbi:MAG TPA: S8 family peptidase [Pyrinomonadaceae bacterium]|nr:S8 family peptidase [Pyrinomonadaceae bacterium]
MPIAIPSPLIDFILLGPLDDRRQLQDSPILGDVWVKFGEKPASRLEVLISPYEDLHAGLVAKLINDELIKEKTHVDANIAYLQGMVVASLTFDEVLRIVLPKTKWWTSKWLDEAEGPEADWKHRVKEYENPETVRSVVDHILAEAKSWRQESETRKLIEIPSLHRFVALTALILWAGRQAEVTKDASDPILNILLDATESVHEISQSLADLVKSIGSKLDDEPLVWQISLNRSAMPALIKSIPAVKADAATTLFKVNCSEISWAVIDSGIDGSHPAFLADNGVTRVKKAYDFTNLRRIINLSNLDEQRRKDNAKILLESGLLDPPTNPEQDLERLAKDADSGRPIHWELVERFVQIKPETTPQTNHGTHVAGILGANKFAANKVAKSKREQDEFVDGMCPDISLYDFRVLGKEIKETEFAIIAALQFIRYLNNRGNKLAVHGANLSLSIPHDVRNFACGRTPVCDECERLVDSGVVVVAAAGNHGYKSFETKEGSYESYAAFSITDPGNADGVITVGATHRFWPHTYGVSFFSSRGPTGDGRLKPDLVAPGERIRAPVPGRDWSALDGTSMAAPHVSGAAAMLMARYSELIRQPRRIKQILCDSATDLGRERSFQGHGMLDVLRAFQSI